jgi:hypothetical protein
VTTELGTGTLPGLLTGSLHLDSEQFLVMQPLSQPQKGL